MAEEACALRPPDEVMTLARMGASFPTRLSFMRSLIRDLTARAAPVTRPVWEIDPDGYGRAVYSVLFNNRPYSLVAFSTPLAPEDRTDRVIAEAWDTTYVLFDGAPTVSDLDRLEANAPRQEAGRFSEKELVLCRANRSVRFFDHCVDALAAGQQPDPTRLQATGYLMRTTAVYGNGKFGIADRAVVQDRPEMNGPFRAEMLTVWLIREFTLDLVDHIAQRRSPDRAAPLTAENRRSLGIGNSTGLGMAPYLVSHPILLNNWILARETALARVRAIQTPDPESLQAFRCLLDRTTQHLADWRVDDTRHQARIDQLRQDFADFIHARVQENLDQPDPWDRIIRASEAGSLDLQELIVSLVLEPHGALIDGLCDCMTANPAPRFDPKMTVNEVLNRLDTHFRWADAYSFAGEPREIQNFWYTSAEKAEPRFGNRFEEAGSEKELPLDIARQTQFLRSALSGEDGATRLVDLVQRRPELRAVLHRVQIAAAHPYSEIRDNLIGSACLPIDMLRFKLAFFGASKFDPKSDLWTRITMFQGAPGRAEVHAPDADDWAFPCFTTTS